MTSAAAPEPDLLFHYTTGAAVLPIVRDRTLWASDAEYLNDSQETRYGRDELRRALEAEAARVNPSGAVGTADASRAMVMRGVSELLDSRDPLGARYDHRAYVACFCEDGDLLSQWRGYADGDGYALGYAVDALRRTVLLHNRPVPAVVEPPPPPPLVRVGYGESARASMVADVVARTAPHPTGHPGVHGFLGRGLVALPGLASVKHPAFQEEREWRLVAVSDAAVETQFRPGRGYLVPFRSVELPADSLRRVVVGPGREAPLRARALAASGEPSGPQCPGPR